MKGKDMRNVLMAGAAAVALTLGASSAYALPPNSPYAIWVPQSVDGYSGYGNDAGSPSLLQALAPGLNEGRSAFTPSEPVPYGSSVVTPEDSTYYSRGR
jgi:hypothetical protein